jgi:predicted flap endonuclease-1-like 5' DNA nuclease
MAKLIDIEGIGPKFGATLATAGLKTTDALLKTAGSAKGRKALAASTKIDEKKILEWVNRADLFRVKGVGGQYSDLLEASGVDTVKELATRKPENLHAKMLEVNTAKKLVRRPPTAAAVAAWVTYAKTLAPAVTY